MRGADSSMRVAVAGHKAGAPRAPDARNSLARETAMFHPFAEYPGHMRVPSPELTDYTGHLLRAHRTLERELRD